MFYHSKRLFTQGPIIPINLIQVWFEPVLTGSDKLSCCLNLRLDCRFSPVLLLNLGLNLGLVLQSLGSNFGSEPNCSITIGDYLALTHGETRANEIVDDIDHR